MGLNFNIPMPDIANSFSKGFGLTDNLMQQILGRNQLKQKAAHEKEALEQAEKHFQLNYGLSKAAAGRAAQAAADAHKKSIHDLDPLSKARDWEALENYFKSKASQGNNAQQESMPTEEFGQGQGVFNPQGLEEARQQEHPQQDASNLPGGVTNQDLALMKQFPALRGLYKKHWGVDPLAGESNVLHGPARDALDLAKLKSQVGDNSEVYQNAKAAYDAQVDAKKDLRDLRARTKAGLKPGEKEFFDKETGAPLGKEIPLTAKERESEEGNILFNELYPTVYKGAAPFSGEGSIARLQQAAAHYKTDPKARQLFDDLLLSDKAMAATVVNEASTLKAGHTNQTYNRLQSALEAQDIPRIIKKLIKEYNIPASAQLKAAMRYQKLLSEARQKARKGSPATQKLFYNPEQQAQQEAQVNEGASTNNGSGVIVVDPSGKRFETTEENAAHLPKGWKRG